MPMIRVDIECPECGHHCVEEIGVSYPDFTADRSKDMGVHETHDLFCENCGTDFEIETFSEMFGISATMAGTSIRFEESHEPEPPDEDYIPPHDVRAEFDHAQSELLLLLYSMTDPLTDKPSPPTPALMRMVFSQLVAALEAYLADRLHREVIDNPKAKLRLVKGAPALNRQTIPLHELIGDPGLAERHLTGTIKAVLYHRFDDVEALYKPTFRSKVLFPSLDNRKALETAVRLRHHCVHRNGKDMEGKLQAITVKDVEGIAETMRELVNFIEQVIKTCQSNDDAERVPNPDRSCAAAPE